MTDEEPPFATTILLDRGVDLVAAAAVGQRLRAAAAFAARRIDPDPVASKTPARPSNAVEDDYRRALDRITEQDGEDRIVEIDLGAPGTATVETDESNTVHRTPAIRVRCDLGGVAMGRAVAVVATPEGIPMRGDGIIDGRVAIGIAGHAGSLLVGALDAIVEDSTRMTDAPMGGDAHRAIGIGPVHDDADHLPHVATALAAEGMRRAGIPDSLAMRLSVVTTLQLVGPPLVSLRFPLEIAVTGGQRKDLPILTGDARRTLAPLARPTMSIGIDRAFDDTLVVRHLSLVPEAVDRSGDPMQALRASRVLAGLDVPAEIIRPAAVERLLAIAETIS